MASRSSNGPSDPIKDASCSNCAFVSFDEARIRAASRRADREGWPPSTRRSTRARWLIATCPATLHSAYSSASRPHASAALARDYEAHTIETADGQSLVGVIRRNLTDAIVVIDASAQEHTLPGAQITSMQPLPTSLMPAGLDHALTEEELLDLVAYLRSCR